MVGKYNELKTDTEKIKVNAGDSTAKTYYSFNTKLVAQLSSVKAIETTVTNFLTNV